MFSFFSRCLTIFVLSFLTSGVFADLTHSINHLINAESRTEKIGVYIQNLNDGEVLYAHNENIWMTPASTTKVFTAAAAYLSLGPNYRYATSIFADSLLTDTLKGNIYVHFSGDPTLRSQDIFSLFNQLAYRGVHKIEGNVIIDESFFTGPYYGTGWGEGDEARCYGAPISAIIINANCSRAGVIRAPDLYARDLVRLALAHSNIYVKGNIKVGKTPAKKRLIAVHYSAPLHTILNFMLKYSDDIYANAIFKTMGQVYTGTGSYAGGASATTAILKHHFVRDFTAPVLHDGSGLSTLNLITPKQLVTLFDYMYKQPSLGNLFIQSLAISGQSGTLVYRLGGGLGGRVFAKTGTLGHDKGGVSTLSGYVIIPKKPVIVFAIMMNNTHSQNLHAEALQDKIIELVAASLRHT